MHNYFYHIGLLRPILGFDAGPPAGMIKVKLDGGGKNKAPHFSPTARV